MLRKTMLIVLVLTLILPLLVFAHNITVGTPTLTGQVPASNYIYVQFDLSWENSFRDDINWDAAWVFVKYKETGGNWNHAYLNTTGSNHNIPAGYTCSAGVTGSYGMGAFIYRSSNGEGDNTLSGVQLRWEYGANGLSDYATVKVKVFAVEMVYVPQGTFYVGDADGNLTNCFRDGDDTGPYQVTGEGEITVGTGDGELYYDQDNGNAGDQSGPIPAAFPKGYAAFYCMKYEISQGQYADFLNTLTSTQDGNRTIQGHVNYTNYRGTISGSQGSRSASAPDRACNYLSWADGCAYADWAGLRPMTELEFEKACRGTQPVVGYEYAWGTDAITAAETISGAEDGTETIINAGANCSYGYKTFTGGDGGLGPLRGGIFAQPGTTREQAGASYYGIMELSGNLNERTVTLGNSAGRLFTGAHGNGLLDSAGDANNVSDWPGTDAEGAGFRGGNFYNSSSLVYVSDRHYMGGAGRSYSYGFRCVRSAP